MDKFDASEWSKLSKDKYRYLTPDHDGHWSDFEVEEDELDKIEYRGVHPDQDQIDELDIEIDDSDQLEDFTWD